MIVAVTGATGTVGRFIVERLLQAGVRVRAWRREGSDLSGLPDTIEWVAGGLGMPHSAEHLVEGADMLVHAALQHVPGRYRGGEGDDLAEFLEANVGGSLTLLATARDAGVKRAVVVSSRAVFGASVTGMVGDDHPVAPDTHYGAAKAALEAFVQSFGQEGWPVAALRPTGVYGIVRPIEKSKWFGLVGAVMQGEPVPARSGTEVHGADVAEAVWRLLEVPLEAMTGRAFNCSDIVVSNREIVELVQELSGIRGPVPEDAPPPEAIMRTEALAALGVKFGGRERFAETIAALIEASRKRV